MTNPIPRAKNGTFCKLLILNGLYCAEGLSMDSAAGQQQAFNDCRKDAIYLTGFCPSIFSRLYFAIFSRLYFAIFLPSQT